MHYITQQYSALHYIMLQCIILHNSTMPYTTLRCNALHYTTVQCLTLHYVTMHYTTQQYKHVQVIFHEHFSETQVQQASVQSRQNNQTSYNQTEIPSLAKRLGDPADLESSQRLTLPHRQTASSNQARCHATKRLCYYYYMLLSWSEK